MKVKVLYFASLKDRVKKDYDKINLKENSTIKDLKSELIKIYPDLEEILNNCMIAKNEEYVEEKEYLNDNDVVAFIPPVGGG